MRGMGKESSLVTPFSFRQSTHNRRVPFFFFTKTIGEAQGDVEGRITPSSNIFSMISCNAARCCAGIRRARCLQGAALPVSILCRNTFVRPSGVPVQAKAEAQSWSNIFSLALSAGVPSPACVAASICPTKFSGLTSNENTASIVLVGLDWNRNTSPAIETVLVSRSIAAPQCRRKSTPMMASHDISSEWTTQYGADLLPTLSVVFNGPKALMEVQFAALRSRRRWLPAPCGKNRECTSVQAEPVSTSASAVQPLISMGRRGNVDIEKPATDGTTVTNNGLCLPGPSATVCVVQVRGFVRFGRAFAG